MYLFKYSDEPTYFRTEIASEKLATEFNQFSWFKANQIISRVI